MISGVGIVIIIYYRVGWSAQPTRNSSKNNIKWKEKTNSTRGWKQLLPRQDMRGAKIKQHCVVHRILISFSVVAFARSPVRFSKLSNKLLIQKFIWLVRDNLFGHRHLIITPFFSLLFSLISFARITKTRGVSPANFVVVAVCSTLPFSPATVRQKRIKWNYCECQFSFAIN